jgi:GH25 family lysozyme M1 (1,4-beta-N-acetylmuramidase)
MQIVIDMWEATQTIKAGATPAAGVIVRLNDMSGGHHLDTNFKAQWTEAEKFGAHALYFVYNPWVSGAANFSWLSMNAPEDTPGRVFIDHELKHAGSPPEQLTPQFYDFMRRVEDWGKRQSIYSGKWFVPAMGAWPTSMEYWWMYYPYSLQNANFSDWEQVTAALEVAQWPDASICPGPIRLWQACTHQAAGGLPGCNGHMIDINKWPGTVAELRAWFGNEPMTGGDKVLVDVDNLRLRTAPVAGSVLAEMSKGTALTVLERKTINGQEWLRVQAEGWTAGWLTKPV